ncbi:hypothetical protein QW060_20445 [Myroides ceti]|uniref:Uncharacterized protein n=1 Tax=Paenimyroides ceti TaxID=395087 RepID=A0ABT8CXU8_9FLAO|nr:hypothetical protein [Paenimyroides ceti]MDN3709383.1 hypothetical protein [Paenimyroides ceti]
MMITDLATALIGVGNTIYAQQVPADIVGNSRINARIWVLINM